MFVSSRYVTVQTACLSRQNHLLTVVMDYKRYTALCFKRGEFLFFSVLFISSAQFQVFLAVFFSPVFLHHWLTLAGEAQILAVKNTSALKALPEEAPYLHCHFNIEIS